MIAISNIWLYICDYNAYNMHGIIILQCIIYIYIYSKIIIIIKPIFELKLISLLNLQC